MSESKKPPKPDNIVLAELEGQPVAYDEETGRWIVGDDPGFDPDEDFDDAEDAEDDEGDEDASAP